MKKTNFEKLVDDPKKILFLVISVVIIIVVVILLWGKIKNLFSGLGNKINQSKELTDHMADTGEGLTLSNSQYDNLANRLEDAFYGNIFGWGTDEDEIYSVFNSLGNKADLLKLISVYGTRDGKTLAEALVDELSRSDLNKVNQILTNKGIDYSF